MGIIWHCLYCGKELLVEEDYRLEGYALEVAKKIQDRLDKLSLECDCKDKDRKLYTQWYKDGIPLSRTEYQNMVKIADTKVMGIKEYLLELGYKHGKVTTDDIKIAERKRKFNRDNEMTYWFDKEGNYLNIRQYERFSKQAQARGLSATEYLLGLGYWKNAYNKEK